MLLRADDNYHLIYPKKNVIGEGGEACGRLCPLGWIAVGRINSDKTGEMHHTNLCQTVSKQQFGGVSTIAEQQDDLNTTLK